MSFCALDPWKLGSILLILNLIYQFRDLIYHKPIDRNTDEKKFVFNFDLFTIAKTAKQEVNIISIQITKFI